MELPTEAISEGARAPTFATAMTVSGDTSARGSRHGGSADRAARRARRERKHAAASVASSALGSDMGAAGGPDGTAEWGRAAPATPWVLVVDDNAAIQRALVRVLARQGHKAVAAENGEAALEAMEAAKAAGTGFMGAIVDRDMPVMDGVELLRRLRDMGAPGPPALPAVMLTGSVTASTKRDALSAGALDVVSKPVNAACVAGILATLAAKAAQDSSRSQVKTVPGAASPARPSHVGRGPARSSSSPAMRNAGERPCEDATAAGMSASRPASPALSD